MDVVKDEPVRVEKNPLLTQKLVVVWVVVVSRFPVPVENDMVDANNVEVTAVLPSSVE